LKHLFKSWDYIDTFLKAGIKLTYPDESEYHPTNETYFLTIFIIFLKNGVYMKKGMSSSERNRGMNNEISIVK